MQDASGKTVTMRVFCFVRIQQKDIQGLLAGNYVEEFVCALVILKGYRINQDLEYEKDEFDM